MIVLVILLLSVSTIASVVTAADNVTVKISILDGKELTRFNKPELIAGLWHYVNLTIYQTIDEFTLRVYKGDTPPTQNKNITNYYEWEYDENTQLKWADISGYSTKYIKPDSCTKNENVYSFYIGVDDTLPNIVDYYENWTLDVFSNGNQLHSDRLVIAKLNTGISMSKPASISFFVYPFTTMDAQGDAFFKIGNVGNIPVSLTIDYEQYDNIVEITNFNTNISIDEVTTHYITVHSKSWQPKILEMTVEGVGSYPKSFFIDSDATVVLYPAFTIDIPLLRIHIGHNNYKINELSGTGVTFQHLDQVTMYEGEIKEIKAYVSGDGAVNLDVRTDEQNIQLIKLYDHNTETSSPIMFTSSNTSERIITVRVKAISEGTTGVITYTLTSGGATQTYTTQITIGPPASSDDNDLSASPDFIGKIIVVMLVLIVVIYMVVSHLRHKRG